MAIQKEAAVSPVVGVMLMLVVTIIIAAVVSGFSGGLVGSGSQKSPSLTMDVKIVNTGYWTGSGFFATITGVSDPIPTKDLKIVTAWTTTNRASSNHEVMTGGNESLGGVQNVNVVEPDASTEPSVTYQSTAPYGFGMPSAAGQTVYSNIINTSAETPYKYTGQQFGSYALTPGVSLNAKPYGSKQDGTGAAFTRGYGITEQYAYTSGSAAYTDPMQAVLGGGWQNLKVGDTVNVKVIYVPSGKTIFTKDIVVTEG
ncbi:MAG: type IV pilin N-terminal domain-containing protein [Methanoregula sp.]